MHAQVCWRARFLRKANSQAPSHLPLTIMQVPYELPTHEGLPLLVRRQMFHVAVNGRHVCSLYEQHPIVPSQRSRNTRNAVIDVL
jgi:hypothetical protein